MKREVKIIEAIRIKISLDKTNPLIWRELLVSRDITFYKLHHAVQIAMGWTNSHLFEFDTFGSAFLQPERMIIGIHQFIAILTFIKFYDSSKVFSFTVKQ